MKTRNYISKRYLGKPFSKTSLREAALINSARMGGIKSVFKLKYPVRVQQEYFDSGAWKKRDVAYADKGTLKHLLGINKIKGSLSRYSIIK